MFTACLPLSIDIYNLDVPGNGQKGVYPVPVTPEPEVEYVHYKQCILYMDSMLSQV